MSRALFGVQRHESQQAQSNAPLHQDPSLLCEPKSLNCSATSSSGMAQREDTRGDDQDENKQNKPRLTIRQLREAAQKETLAKELAKASQKPQENQSKATAVPQKKKPSIFGGLFQVREPTQIALNQVAAQMIAQHGSTSAMKVPNVRLEKMPDFVPKVNSKWDGIPESVKQREKKEKDKESLKARRESLFSADSKFNNDRGRRRMSSRNSSSTTGSSFGVYGSSSGSQGASSHSRFYAQSVNSSGDLASQQRTDISHFTRALASQPGAENISERPHSRRRLSSAGTAQHVGHQNSVELDPPKSSVIDRSHTVRPRSIKSCGTESSGPPRSSATNRSLENQTESMDKAIAWESVYCAQAARSYVTPSVRATSTQFSSPTRSFRDLSPATPRQFEPVGTRHTTNEMNLQTMLSSGHDVLGLPPVRKRKSQTQIRDADAFLAGEAQELVLLEENDWDGHVGLTATPSISGQRTADNGRSRVQQDLEKRPDSSRDRLGLRASMLFTDEATPWEQPGIVHLPPPSPKIEQQTPNTTKRFHKPFGKFGK